MMRRMPPTGRATLSTREAARRLGVSVSFLNKARMAGHGPAAYMYGRKVVYLPSDVEAYAAAHRQEPDVALAPSPSCGNEGGRA
ncbi:helix-turn-helix domain-containing protein [Methylobacterium mesophilicum]|uniref:helix-turn-helix domain-containing protein n=1 Tax=Methylobacterium mesophilicum TaxID=39956 RepID=UPI003613E12A